MHGAEPDQDAYERANELYWRSDLSVNQIAERLDLSKGALYGLIEPLPVGLECPACSSEVAYTTRTAQERGQVSCPGCGWQGEEDEADSLAGEASVTLPAEEEPVAPMPPALPPDRGRNRVILGGALLGAAAGLAMVLWARRR